MPIDELQPAVRLPTSDARRTAAGRARRRRPLRTGRGRDERARAQVRRQEEHGRRAGAVQVQRVGRPRRRGRSSRLLELGLEVDARPTSPRETSSIVGGGAAASSSVQIAVSTVDLPLDASPTSAHIEPRLELELARRAVALHRDRISAAAPPLRVPRARRGTRPGRRAASGARKRWIGGCRTISSSSSASNSRWPRTAASREVDAPRASGPPRSPAKMMWTTCFAAKRALRRDRVDDRDRALRPAISSSIADLLASSRCERVDEALARVDAAAREQPVLASPGFSCRQSRIRSCQRSSAETRMRGSAPSRRRTSRSRARRARSPAARRPRRGSTLAAPAARRAARSASPARRRTARARSVLSRTTRSSPR